MLYRWLPKGNTKQAMEEKNPILEKREIGTETDTGRMKIGDGTTPWNSLKYAFDTIPTFSHGGGTYTLVPSDANSRQLFTATATLVIPAAIIPAGSIIEVAQGGSGQVTLQETAPMVVRTPYTKKTKKQYSTATIYFESTNESWLGGDLE